jgi:hypothetical protein
MLETRRSMLLTSARAYVCATVDRADTQHETAVRSVAPEWCDERKRASYDADGGLRTSEYCGAEGRALVAAGPHRTAGEHIACKSFMRCGTVCARSNACPRTWPMNHCPYNHLEASCRCSKCGPWVRARPTSWLSHRSNGAAVTQVPASAVRCDRYPRETRRAR